MSSQRLRADAAHHRYSMHFHSSLGTVAGGNIRTVPGEGLEPSRPEGPAGLSRLRLPVTPPGRAGRNGKPPGRHPTTDEGNRSGGGRLRTHRTSSSDCLQQGLTHPAGDVARQPVRDDDPFDHVGNDIGRRPGPQPDRNHRAAREPADRARDSGVARWCAECRSHQPGRTRRRADAAGKLGEPNRRCDVHQPY